MIYCPVHNSKLTKYILWKEEKRTCPMIHLKKQSARALKLILSEVESKVVRDTMDMTSVQGAVV